MWASEIARSESVKPLPFVTVGHRAPVLASVRRTGILPPNRVASS